MRDSALARWLGGLPGRRLTRLTFARFVADGDPVSLDEIGFELDGVFAGKIACASDGESLRCSDKSVKRLEVGEYGARELFDHMIGIDLGKLVGATISSVDEINEGRVAIGFALTLSNGSEFLILNAGDDLLVSQDGDHPALQEPAVSRCRLA